MSRVVEPPKVIVKTISINNYKYGLSNIIPHTSVKYEIDCFNDNVYVKTITGLLEGEQYKEWTTDDWLYAFIKSKVEALPNVEVIEPVKPVEHSPNPF